MNREPAPDEVCFLCGARIRDGEMRYVLGEHRVCCESCREKRRLERLVKKP